MNSKLLSSMRVLLFSLTVPLSTSCATQERAQNQLESRSFSFTPMPIKRTEISCTAITSLNVGSAEPVPAPNAGANTNQLSAEIFGGTDRLSIRIEADHLIFLTKAAFEGGVTEGPRFPLLENNAEFLKAVESFPSGVGTLESFVLNKRNGLAIWTKIRPGGPFGQAAPDSQTIYVACM